MCMPGDNIEMTIELIHPIAMSQGLTFAIREGGRTVGSGRVATIIERDRQFHQESGRQVKSRHLDQKPDCNQKQAAFELL